MKITVVRTKNGCLVVLGEACGSTSQVIRESWSFTTAKEALPLLKILLAQWSGIEPTEEEKKRFNLT